MIEEKRFNTIIGEEESINTSYHQTANMIISKIMNSNIDEIKLKNTIVENLEQLSEIMIKYKKILEQILILSKEVCVESTLDLSILYSYLLWNGYLSKDKEYYFTSYDRRNIMGLFFIDIMNGKGDCLNSSEMLKDLLIKNGHSSSIIMNYYSSNIRLNKVLDIKRDFKYDESKLKFIISIYNDITKRYANHIFNLIEEKDKLYIYDTTNLSICSVNNSYTCSIINGKGKVKLFPYSSYCFAASEKEIRLIDKLLKEKRTKTPYEEEDFKDLGQLNLEIFNENKSLIEDFYAEIRHNIIGIIEEANKIMVKKRLK